MKDYFSKETELRKYAARSDIKDYDLDKRWNWHKDNLLNPIREFIGKPLHLTSAERTIKTTTDLLQNGFNPSFTSDHFCGNSINLLDILSLSKKINKKGLSIQPKIKIYGKKYLYSTFATDVVFTASLREYEEVFLEIKANIENKSNTIPEISDAKQIILEISYNDVMNRDFIWLHIASPMKAFFSEYICNKYYEISKTPKFLVYYKNQYILPEQYFLKNVNKLFLKNPMY